MHRFWEGAVGMRVVGRHDKVFGPDLVDDIDSRFLADVERDIALAPEVFARQHRDLALAARSELLPLIVEPPEPPIEPPRRPFEEGAAQSRVTIEHAAARQAGERPHQLDRVAEGVGDRVKIGVPDITSPGIVLERRRAGRMEPDRHVEPFEFVP